MHQANVPRRHANGHAVRHSPSFTAVKSIGGHARCTNTAIIPIHRCAIKETTQQLRMGRKLT